MSGVYGLAVLGATKDPARLFETLLVGVMAVLAQRLPVGAIPEQFGIAVMGLNMINHCCLGDAAMVFALGAQWVFSQPANPGALPAIAVHAQSPLRRGIL